MEFVCKRALNSEFRNYELWSRSGSDLTLECQMDEAWLLVYVAEAWCGSHAQCLNGFEWKLNPILVKF